MFDIGIIGAGPAGYTAAIKASQAGLKTVIFEKEHMGGTCLNKGCIPVKTVLHSCLLYKELKSASKYGVNCENISFDFMKIMERQKSVSEKLRKNLTALIKSYGITVIEEEAHIKSDGVIETANGEYDVKNIIIASGSKPNKLKIQGNYDNNFVITTDEILELKQLPKHITIAGSGAVGIEWSRILSALGVRVCLIEKENRLIPSADFEISERMARLFGRSGIDFYTSSVIENISGKTVTLSGGKFFETDFVLLAAGRKPVTGENVNKTDKDKFIKTDNNFRTNTGNIYAIGDVNGKSMLAHSAMRQAENVIDFIVKNETPNFDKNLVPSVIYGTPEIAFIGKTEQELISEGIQYKKSVFPVSALGKAHADDKIEGFVKILANDIEILGAHIISEEASAMIEQIAVAAANKISPKSVNKAIFAHPTYSESIGESIMGLYNSAIHIPQKVKIKK